MSRILVALILLALIGGGGWAASHYFSDLTDPDRLTPEVVKVREKIKALEVKAKAGDAQAQFDLAVILHEGPIMLRDREEALLNFKRAGQGGIPEAYFRIGRIYETGDGVRQDEIEAVKWYRLAATFSQHRDANFALGQLHFTGRGVLQDYATAIEHYLAAAERGHPVAQHLLGIMFKEGWGVRRDRVRALKWFILAARKRNLVLAFNKSFDPEFERGGLVLKMNITEVNEGERLAREFQY